MNLRSSSRNPHPHQSPIKMTTTTSKQKEEETEGKNIKKTKSVPIHGRARSIKRRRQSFEATRSMHMMKLRGSSGFFRRPKTPLQKWRRENPSVTITPPIPVGCRHSACPTYDSRQVCVIEKCEMWLESRPLEEDVAHADWERSVEQEMEREAELIAMEEDAERNANNQNQPIETESRTAPLILPLTLRQLARDKTPLYSLNVKVVGMHPSFKAPAYRLVRGHCPNLLCNRTYSNIDWQKSGPESFRNLLRPFCPNCITDDRRSYLDLFFYLEMAVVDESDTMKNIIIQRESAMRFFGCSVYKYLTERRYADRVQSLLAKLYRKCKPNSSIQSDGMSFTMRVIPVATDSLSKVQLHLFGDNEPLVSLVTHSTQFETRG